MTMLATTQWWDIKKVHQTIWQGLVDYTRIIVWEQALNKMLIEPPPFMLMCSTTSIRRGKGTNSFTTL